MSSNCPGCGLAYNIHVSGCPVNSTDAVNHPPHYTNGSIETIDIIEVIIESYDPVIGWSIGQVVKYCARAPLKANLVEDLKKARWYLERAISAAEERAD